MSEPISNINAGGPTSRAGETSQGRSRRRPRLSYLFLLAVLIAGGWYVWTKIDSARATTLGGSIPHKAGASGANPAGPAIPVIAAHARGGDIGVYVTGLGSVTPLYTVMVKTRVDGQIMAIHYREGDTVPRCWKSTPGRMRRSSSSIKGNSSATRRCWRTQKWIWVGMPPL